MDKTFDNYVHELNARLGDRLFFVEVGAMDGVSHDALHPHIIANPDWSGILVEPLPDMFAMLKETYKGRKNLKFEKAAITSRNGHRQITRIPLEKSNRVLPFWTDGIATLRPDTHIIHRYDYLKPHAVKESIRTITFKKLVDKHGIKQIDIFQSDTEGYDKDIFDQLWAAGFRPHIIKLEALYI
jgi:FkbM family methyltransferase